MGTIVSSRLTCTALAFFASVSARGQTQTLEQLYNNLNLTLALPAASRALGAGGNPKVDSGLRVLLNSAPARP